MRIALLGDTHGNGHWINRGLQMAHDDDCDVLVQLGDFGIWSGALGTGFARNVRRLLDARPMPMYVVPGNHDSYDEIDLLTPDADGWLPWIDQRVWVTPRGHTWTWAGRRFGAMGGAVSIDQDSRVEGLSWWPQEAITSEQADAMCATAGKLDVLLVHDTPQGAHEELTDNSAWRSWIPPRLLAASRVNREHLRRLVDATRPELVVGGHWHEHLDDTITLADGHQTRVVNLAHDGTPGSYAVLDITDDTMVLTTEDGC